MVPGSSLSSVVRLFRLSVVLMVGIFSECVFGFPGRRQSVAASRRPTALRIRVFKRRDICVHVARWRRITLYLAFCWLSQVWFSIWCSNFKLMTKQRSWDSKAELVSTMRDVSDVCMLPIYRHPLPCCLSFDVSFCKELLIQILARSKVYTLRCWKNQKLPWKDWCIQNRHCTWTSLQKS